MPAESQRTATKPASQAGRGGTRRGAGRPSIYSSEFAKRLLAYCAAHSAPSLRGFAAEAGVSTRQIRRWELQHSDFACAVGVLRYRREIGRGHEV